MADLRPRRMVDLDLARGLPAGGLEVRDRPVFLVVWWRRLLLGYGELHRSVNGPELAARVARLVAPSVARRLLAAGLGVADAVALPELLGALDAQEEPATDRRPSITLAVCTRDRPKALERCLRAIAAAGTPPDELLVVDNAPAGAATREVVARFPAARYVGEARPGLSAARNAAVREATGVVVAFVDDDVSVQENWLEPLRRAFADPEVMAVMGLVLPAALETPAQVAFETMRGGLARGSVRGRYDHRSLRATRREGMPVWELGAGANMAIRRAAFALVGGFDERLGAGAAGCSEDSELWYRLISAGWACCYEPDSVVFHHHRREPAELERQVHDYTRGHVAALFVQFARSRDAGNLRRALLTLPRQFARRVVRELPRRAAVRAGLAARRPVDLTPPELTGYLRGLASLPLALTSEPPRHKAPLGRFLAGNPFPHPYTLGFFYREKMRAIHRVAPDLPAAEVLEIGGGRSGLARRLYPDALVTTVDVDEEHGAADVNQDPRVRFLVADATDLPFPDASFDVVTFFDVLEHIPDHERAAAEALRVVRPGGFVLVTTPRSHWHYPHWRVLAPICPPEEELTRAWGHVRRGYSAQELASLFGRPPVRTAGFISPATALGHDLAWSKLPARARRGLLAAMSPLTWAAYGLQGPSRRGTEIAASWRRPDL